MSGELLLTLLAALTLQAPTVPAGAPAAADTLGVGTARAEGGDFPPVGREAIEALTFPPLVFEPPEAAEHEVLGIPVYHLHDPSLPLVDFFVQLRGGAGHLSREELAAATALPAMLRTGGTSALPPDSVDLRIDLLALQLSLAGGGGGTFAGLNALTHTLDEGMDLLRDLLIDPGFDKETLEVWRGQEAEWIRRREDDPGSLAYSEFNRLMFGDHPTGWIMVEEDLSPERLSRERLRDVHGKLICRDRLILGVSGDLTWEDARERVERFLEPWPECDGTLAEPPHPEIRAEGGVFILPKAVEQSTVVMAQPGGILQGDTPEYFASRISDHILGAGGFTSRIMSRIRTEQGLAYGASSLWTSSRRYEGILGAVTATRPERTVEATRLLLEIMEEFRGVPPLDEEVADALSEIANSYVFAFASASQIVSRRMAYRAQELPDHWLERYLEGLQEVTPGSIAEVTGTFLDPSRMTILIVGDPERFDPGIEALGTLYELSPDGSYRPWSDRP